MRISFVTPGITLSGGMLAVIGFSNGLASRGHDVCVVTPRAHVDDAVNLLRADVRVVRSRVSIRPRPGGMLTNASLAFDLGLVVPQSDALIATYAPTTIPTLLAATLGRGRPYWYYADYLEMFAKRPLERWIIRSLPRRFCRVFTNSFESIRELKELSGIESTFVGLGLPRWSHLGPRENRRFDRAVALYVGDSRERKGMREFVEAVRIARERLPDLCAQIVTKDDAPIDLPMPFERFVRPSDETIAALYRECGVFVSTSWSESLGLPPLEAMACGAPTVITNHRGSRDYAVDGVNCLVVPIRSPGETADSIVRVMTDPELAGRLSRAGVETAERYRWEPAIERCEAVLSSPCVGRWLW